MIKLYDENNNYIISLSNYSNLKITSTITKGYNTLEFNLPLVENLIKKEYKVEYNHYRYVIKEIDINNKFYFSIYCKPDLDELYAGYIKNTHTEIAPIEYFLDLVLNETEWTYKIHDFIPGELTITLENMAKFDALLLVLELFNVEFYFDTFNKVLDVWYQRGERKGSFILDSTNIYDYRYQSNTYDLATVLIPLGKDGINIADFNEGKIYLENHQYSNKNIVNFYINDKISEPYNLYTLAKNKLDQISQPATTYIIKLSCLAKYNLAVGDYIRIIDKFTNTDEYYRINKITLYEDDLTKSYITCGSSQVLFDNLYNSNWNNQNNFMLNTYNTLNKES